MKEIENIVNSQKVIKLRKIVNENLKGLDGQTKELEQLEKKIKQEIDSQVGFFTSNDKRIKIETATRAKYLEQQQSIHEKYQKIAQ